MGHREKGNLQIGRWKGRNKGKDQKYTEKAKIILWTAEHWIYEKRTIIEVDLKKGIFKNILRNEKQTLIRQRGKYFNEKTVRIGRPRRKLNDKLSKIIRKKRKIYKIAAYIL